MPFFKGEVKENPRKVFIYWSDDGDLVAVRFAQWKLHFQEQRAHGLGVWREPFVPFRVPKLFNLKSDPFEAADRDATMYYDKWFADRGFVMIPAQAMIAEYLKTFQEFPRRQRPASFSIDHGEGPAAGRRNVEGGGWRCQVDNAVVLLYLLS